MKIFPTMALCFATLISCLALNSAVQADDQTIDLKAVTMEAPKDWKKQEPRSRIINYEFAAPKVEGDSDDGRLTVMAAGGSIEANIDRWIGQFTQADGKATRDRAKISKKMISGLEVHLVDISGNFKDMPRGPFGPSVDREKYRMMAAIVVAGGGQFFFKFYGPEKTIAQHEKAFTSMVEGLKRN